MCSGAEQCSNHILELPRAKIDMTKIADAQDCIESAKDPDLVASLEDTVTEWCKRIEVVSFENVCKVMEILFHLILVGPGGVRSDSKGGRWNGTTGGT